MRGRTVLTTAHVIAGARAVSVRRPDKVLRAAEVQWNFVGNEDGPDLALLEIDDNTIDLAPIDLAVVDRNIATPVENCHAVGYPQFAERPPKRETEEVWGFIPGLSGLADGLLTINVRNSPRPLPPGRIALGESEWSGMSGAPVLVEGCLLGVVSGHAPRQGTSAVTVVPLTALEPDPGHPAWGQGASNAHQWWERLGVTGLSELRSFPARTVRPEPDYRAQIRTIKGRTPQLRDRDRELANLAAFAIGSDGYLHLVGGAKVGKTALVAEAVMTAMPPSVDAINYFLSRVPRRFPWSPSSRTNREEFLAAVVPQLAYLLDEDSPHPDLDQFRLLWDKAADRAAATGRHLLLIIDGLNEDRHLHGLPSVASLLPQNLSEHAHVLLTSRPNLKLPRDVPAGHPVRAARLSLLPRSAARRARSPVFGESCWPPQW